MDNLPSNIEIETSFAEYCKDCSVSDLELNQDTFYCDNFKTMTKYNLICRHADACERAAKWKTKKEKNQILTDGNQTVTVNTADGETIVRKIVKL